MALRLLASFLAHLFLGQSTGQLTETHGLFHRVQILPLQILDQGQFHGLLVGNLTDDHRHLGQTGHPGGAPAPFTAMIL